MGTTTGRASVRTRARAPQSHEAAAPAEGTQAPTGVESLPVIFLVSADASVVRALESDLSRRFASDSRIVSAIGVVEGLERIRALSGTPDPVALMIADQRMPGLTGVEFLERAHALHPHAKRILLMERDYTTANPIITAMTHGQIDYHLAKPWAPERRALPRGDRFPRELGQRPQRGILPLPAGRAGEQPARPRDPRPPHPVPDAVHVPHGRLERGNRAARRDRADRVRGSRCGSPRRPGPRRSDRCRPGRGRSAARRAPAPRSTT